jgi:hypothetical protein
MLIFAIICLMISPLLLVMNKKFENKTPEFRLLMFIPGLIIGIILIYKLDSIRKENIKDSIDYFVKGKRGELESYRRTTSDGMDRRQINSITDINTYLEVRLKDGRIYIVGFKPELFGDYFGSLYEFKEWYKPRG